MPGAMGLCTVIAHATTLVCVCLFTGVCVASLLTRVCGVCGRAQKAKEKHVSLPRTDLGDDAEEQRSSLGSLDNFDMFAPSEQHTPSVSPLDSPPSLAEAVEVEGEGASIDNVTKWQMWILGAVTGLLSPLTGTSGAVVFLPLALTMNYPIMNALGAAQLVQFPISCASSISFALTMDIDIPLAIALSAGATPAVIAGSYSAHRLNKLTLHYVVTGLLLVSSGVLLIEVMIGDF